MRGEGDVAEVCLAMKKRGHGAGLWNGAGGKLEAGETVEQAMARETWEELGVKVLSAQPRGVLQIYFQHEPSWDAHVHVFVVREWEGDPKESEEMRPEWFPVSQVPYDRMWAADKLWLPQVLLGQSVGGSVTFSDSSRLHSSALMFGDAGQTMEFI